MIAPRPLREDTLTHHARRVAVPTYDRQALRPAVVHISVGSFHRSHQAMYFDELAQRGITDWGLVGVGLRRPEMRDALAPQDGLYTVVARDADRDHARVVGVIGRYLFAPEQGVEVLAALADPRTRLVTLTITGGGYDIDPVTGALDLDQPDVAADVANPSRPSTAIGYVVDGLQRRRRAGLPPFTVLSCDNVAGNGRLARGAVLAFAAARDPGLAEWVEAHGAFPSSMVDRITPKTTEEDRTFVAARFGLEDRWPVITEPFTDWVIEDDFCHGRPPLDAVGVRFVDDVRPYSLIKTRLLNAGHCALGHLGYLAGHRRTDQAMADPVFREAVAAMMRDEVAPLLPDAPGIDPAAYRRTVLARLSNPRVGDRLSRLCRNGSSKVPVHVVSSLVQARAEGRPHGLLALTVAAWCRYLRGCDDRGRRFEIEDRLAPRLTALAWAGGTDPRPLLRERVPFGSLGEDPGFVAAVSDALERLDRLGARGALAEHLARTGAVAA